jgi:phospholipase C
VKTFEENRGCLTQVPPNAQRPCRGVAGGVDAQRQRGGMPAFGLGDAERVCDPQGRPRRVVVGELPRRAHGLSDRPAERTRDRLDRFDRDRARAQKHRLRIERDDRRLDSELGATAVEDQVGAIAQRRYDVLGACRAQSAKRVRARRGKRRSDRFEQRSRHRMRRHANGHRLQSGSHQMRNLRRLWQYDCQRTGPETFDKQPPERRKCIRDSMEHRAVEHVDDQRIEVRTSLDFENACRSRGIESERSQAVNRLGRKGNYAAAVQNLGRAGNASPIRNQHLEGMAPARRRYLYIMPVSRRSSRAFTLAGTFCAGLFAMLLGGCGGGSSAGAGPLLPPAVAKKGKYFTHIVIIIQENRTFDNLFATFPGADGTTTGKTHDGKSIPLRSANLESPVSPNNGYSYWRRDCNADRGGTCRMNDFDVTPIGKVPGTYVYQYVQPAQIRPYWDLAKQYVLSDHTFQTQGSGSFTAHQDLIRGGTELGNSQALIDFPSDSGYPWGCDAPSGTTTSLITADNRYEPHTGPFPCLTYATLRDLLDAGGVSWRYYAPVVGSGFAGNLWNAFDAIHAVRYGAEWSTNVVSPETDVFTDIDRDTLPSVAWVIPDYANSDHPGDSSDTGPSWVAQVVNAIGQSPAWKTTAILVLWDDWGGWYDHVPPPGRRRYGGLGFRVPLMAVSPYAKIGYVSHLEYQFGSVVKFVEDNWDLGRLGTSDEHSADFVDDFFDFAQKPRAFAPIQSAYSKAFFLRQPPSNKPVDYE